MGKREERNETKERLAQQQLFRSSKNNKYRLYGLTKPCLNEGISEGMVADL